MAIRVVAQRYELESEIGRGGMAVVYRARDLRLNRHVAFKLLHPYLATQAESAARFLRESEAIAKLHHPNIVEIFDAGHDEETGSQFLVMELVGGMTLSAFIAQHATRIPEIAVAMLCCLCDAVEHAHKAGIIHRDIKPENIMFSKTGQLKLMDFGIARILDADRMTASGSLIGSPAHMPPEIIEGQSYTFSCDIFSLGTVLYYALTQTLPFRGNTPMAVFKAILDGNYQTPGRICQTVTKKIDAVVAKCLKTEPAERYQSIQALRTDLLEILKVVNFEDYGTIVKQYFADPEAFYDTHMPTVKACFQASAGVAVQEHRLPVALECLNCILAYDPDDEQAAVMLRKLRTGNTLRHRLFIAFSSLLALGILIGIGIFIFAPTQHPETQVQALPQDTVNMNSGVKNIVQRVDQNDEVESTSDGNGELSAVAAGGKESFNKGDIRRLMWSTAAQLLPTEKTTKVPDPVNPIHSNDSALWKVPTDIAQTPEEPTDIAQTQEEKSKSLGTGQRIRTPKKTATMKPTAVEALETHADAVILPSEASVTTPTEMVKSPTEAPALVKLVQPVFPPDAYAVINGQRYAANTSGDIELLLPPGKYQMLVTCHRRCVRQTVELSIRADAPNTTREIISLDWSNASLNVSGPVDKKLYYVARRLDDRSQRVYHLVPGMPNAISGFNAFGKPIQLEVYAIPTENTLKSYDAAALEIAKYASTRVALSPGDNKVLQF